jgi:hypothetical protein
MKASVGVALALSLGFGTLGWWWWKYHSATGATLIALGAVAVSSFAVFQSSRSAHAASRTSTLAQMNEERSRYGWVITVHPDGDRYVLRNTGTLTAHDVRFINVDPHTFIQFEQHEGEGGPTIPRGQAVAFHASFTYGSASNAVQFDWLPDGEATRQTFKDVLDDIPNKAFEETVKERANERAVERAAFESYAAECRRLLIDLAEAWGVYQQDANAQNKMRVQALVAALPSNMAKEMGYVVDVLRDHWGQHQWPLDGFVLDPKDKKLVRENAPMIELMWNLMQVQIPKIVEGDNSQSPMGWFRIEHAVSGYVELVRDREEGKRELVDGPRDRKQREEAMRMIQQNEAQLRARAPRKSD